MTFRNSILKRRRPGKTSALFAPVVLWALVGAAQAGPSESFVQTTDADQGEKIRVCILPFFDTGISGHLRSDLGPLLEAYLAEDPRLELVPSRKVYERFYELEGAPWLVKGIWEDGREPRDAESYTWLHEGWLIKAKVRFPSDYYVVGRVIATGRKRNVVARLMTGIRPDRAVFTALAEAPTEEEIPEAVRETADRIRRFLGLERSEAHLREIRRERLARVRSLTEAVREGEEAVAVNPESVALRLLLLSFYAEDRSTYGDRLLELAGEIVRAWDGRDSDATKLSYELGIDPFLLLCEEQERKGDWSGVLETARLGMEKHPLRSAEYSKWASRAEERLLKGGGGDESGTGTHTGTGPPESR